MKNNSGKGVEAGVIFKKNRIYLSLLYFNKELVW